MFLTNGKLVHCNADGTEEALYTTQTNQRSLTIGTSYQADVILNQSLSDAAASAAIYCEITGDAFGRISIANKSVEQLLVNGVHIKKQRPLQNASDIQIGTHKFRWECDTAARPITPTELLQKSQEHIKNIHKTVSHSEPSRNKRAQKTARKIKQLASKTGRFTIYTRCPETIGNSNSDENSMNEANSANEAEEEDEEDDDEEEEGDKEGTQNDDVLSPSDRLVLDDSGSADVMLNASDAAEKAEESSEQSSALESSITEQTSNSTETDDRLPDQIFAVSDVEQSSSNVSESELKPTKDIVNTIDASDTQENDNQLQISVTTVSSTVSDLDQNVYELSIIACDSPEPSAVQSVEDGPIDEAAQPDVCNVDPVKNDDQVQDSAAEDKQTDEDPITKPDAIEADVEDISIVAEEASKMSPIADLSVAVSAECSDEIVEPNVEECDASVPEESTVESIPVEDDGITDSAATDNRAQSSHLVSDEVSSAEDTPIADAIETDVEDIPNIACRSPESVEIAPVEPEASPIADDHVTDSAEPEDHVSSTDVSEPTSVSVEDGPTVEDIDTPTAEIEETTDEVIKTSSSVAAHDETVVDAPIPDLSKSATDPETDAVSELVQNVEAVTIAAEDAQTIVEAAPDNVLSTDDLTDMDLIGLDESLTEQMSTNDALQSATELALAVDAEPSPTPVDETDEPVSAAAAPPVLTTPMPVRRRSLRLSVDRSMCETCEVPETPRPTLNAIAETETSTGADAALPPLKTPARRRSVRNSIEQPPLSESVVSTPKGKRGGPVAGLLAKVRAVDSPSLKTAAATEKLTPRRRLARKSTDLTTGVADGLRTPLVDQELKNKLDMIRDSPDENEAHAIETKTPSRRRPGRKALDLVGIDDKAATPKALTVLGAIVEMDNPDTDVRTPSLRRSQRKSVDLSGPGELMATPKVAKGLLSSLNEKDDAETPSKKRAQRRAVDQSGTPAKKRIVIPDIVVEESATELTDDVDEEAPQSDAAQPSEDTDVAEVADAVVQEENEENEEENAAEVDVDFVDEARSEDAPMVSEENAAQVAADSAMPSEKIVTDAIEEPQTEEVTISSEESSTGPRNDVTEEVQADDALMTSLETATEQKNDVIEDPQTEDATIPSYETAAELNNDVVEEVQADDTPMPSEETATELTNDVIEEPSSEDATIPSEETKDTELTKEVVEEAQTEDEAIPSEISCDTEVNSMPLDEPTSIVCEDAHDSVATTPNVLSDVKAEASASTALSTDDDTDAIDTPDANAQTDVKSEVDDVTISAPTATPQVDNDNEDAVVCQKDAEKTIAPEIVKIETTNVTLEPMASETGSDSETPTARVEAVQIEEADGTIEQKDEPIASETREETAQIETNDIPAATTTEDVDCQYDDSITNPDSSEAAVQSEESVESVQPETSNDDTADASANNATAVQPLAAEQELTSTHAGKQSPPANPALERIANHLNITESDLEVDLDVTMSEAGGVISAAGSLSDLTDIEDVAKKSETLSSAIADNGDSAAAVVAAAGGDDDDAMSATKSDETSTLPLQQTQHTSDVVCESIAAQEPQQVMADAVVDTALAAGETAVADLDSSSSPQKSDPTTMGAADTTESAAATASEYDDDKAKLRTTVAKKEEEQDVDAADGVCETMAAVSVNSTPVVDDVAVMATKEELVRCPETEESKMISTNGSEEEQCSRTPAQVDDLPTNGAVDATEDVAKVVEDCVASALEEEHAKVKSVEDDSTECASMVAESAPTVLDEPIETPECTEHENNVEPIVADPIDEPSDAELFVMPDVPVILDEPSKIVLSMTKTDEAEESDAQETPVVSNASIDVESPVALQLNATDSLFAASSVDIPSSPDAETVIAKVVGAVEESAVETKPIDDPAAPEPEPESDIDGATEGADKAVVFTTKCDVKLDEEPDMFADDSFNVSLAADESDAASIAEQKPETVELSSAENKSEQPAKSDADEEPKETLVADESDAALIAENPDKVELSVDDDTLVKSAQPGAGEEPNVSMVADESNEPVAEQNQETIAEPDADDKLKLSLVVDETDAAVIEQEPETVAENILEEPAKHDADEKPLSLVADESDAAVAERKPETVAENKLEKSVKSDADEEHKVSLDADESDAAVAEAKPEVVEPVVVENKLEDPAKPDANKSSIAVQKQESDEQSVADSTLEDPAKPIKTELDPIATSKETTPVKSRRSTSKSLSKTRDIEPSPSENSAASTRQRRTSKRSSAGGDELTIKTSPSKRQSLDKTATTAAQVLPAVAHLAVESPAPNATPQRAVRGRARKNSQLIDVLAPSAVTPVVDAGTPTVRRGRPRKASTAVADIVDAAAEVVTPDVRPARRTARKASVAVEAAPQEKQESGTSPAKGSASTSAAPSPMDVVAAVAKRRGRARRPTIDTAIVPEIVEVPDDDVPQPIGNKRKSIDSEPTNNDDTDQQSPKVPKLSRSRQRRSSGSVIAEEVVVTPAEPAEAVTVSKRKSLDGEPIDVAENATKVQKTTRGGVRGRKPAAQKVEEDAMVESEATVVEDAKPTRKATTTTRGKRAATPLAVLSPVVESAIAVDAIVEDPAPAVTKPTRRGAKAAATAATDEPPARKATTTRGKRAATPSAVLSPVAESTSPSKPSPQIGAESPPPNKKTIRGKRNLAESCAEDSTPVVVQDTPPATQSTLAEPQTPDKDSPVKADKKTTATTSTRAKRNVVADATTAADPASPKKETAPVVAAKKRKVTETVAELDATSSSTTSTTTIEVVVMTSSPKRAGRRRTPALVESPVKEPTVAASKPTRGRRGKAASATVEEETAEVVEPVAIETPAIEEPTVAAAATKATRGKRGKNAAAAVVADPTEVIDLDADEPVAIETPAIEEPTVAVAAPKATRGKRDKNAAAAVKADPTEVIDLDTDEEETPVDELPVAAPAKAKPVAAPKATRGRRGKNAEAEATDVVKTDVVVTSEPAGAPIVAPAPKATRGKRGKNAAAAEVEAETTEAIEPDVVVIEETPAEEQKTTAAAAPKATRGKRGKNAATVAVEAVDVVVVEPEATEKAVEEQKTTVSAPKATRGKRGKNAADDDGPKTAEIVEPEAPAVEAKTGRPKRATRK